MGKKKKSLASKFAKMSDDQRAKYMQLKADQEEEVRRRKEQLLNTFMKNKIKREDAFSRLNKAKINLEWHQFLRIRKCKEMKENCEYMKKWIERILGLKNRIIDNLIKELDEAEFQYSNNLQSHFMYIEEIIEFYNKYANQLKKEYNSDSDLLLKEWKIEKEILKSTSENSLVHLKTIIFGQENEGEKSIRENHDFYLKRLDEFSKECKIELNQLKKSKERTSGAIWSHIASSVKVYVDQTDKRRAQLAEMKRLDANNAQEISRNQERIQLEEIQIEKLREEYKNLIRQRTETIDTLNKTVEDLKKSLLNSKRNLKKDLDHDDEKLRILSQHSKEALESLEGVEKKLGHLLELAQNCRKYETQKEKILRFYKGDVNDYFVDESESNGDLEEIMKIVVEEKQEKQKEREEDVGEKEEERNEREEEGNEREEEEEVRNDIYKTETYKILIQHKFKMKPSKSQVKISEGVQKELERIDFDKRERKKLEEKKYFDVKSTGILEECVESLMDLEGMWNLCNKVKIDCSELREEKSVLKQENEYLKRRLKMILEEAVLESRTIKRKDVRVKRYASAPIRYA